MVPRAAAGGGPATVANVPATPPPPPAPPAKAFVTYDSLPASRPPPDEAPPKSTLAPLPEPHAPDPPAIVSPAPALTSGASPGPAPKASLQPEAATPPREGWSTGRVIAVAATVVLLAGSLAAALLLSGGGDREPESGAAVAASTPPPKTSATPAPTGGLANQVRTLDDLMKASQAGRNAAVEGDTGAAIANRTKLLEDLRGLSKNVSDVKLKAGLRDFTAAIEESLRQNRECGADCPAADLNQVNRLKQRAVEQLNPLLRKYAKTSYRAREI